MAELDSTGVVATGKPSENHERKLVDDGLRSVETLTASVFETGRVRVPATTVAPNAAETLRRDYWSALQSYLRDGAESDLREAYELGREASAAGLGVLHMVRLHHACVALFTGDDERRAVRAEEFLLEALSPFEATHRGFRQAHGELHETRAHYERLLTQSRGMEETLRQLSKRILDAQEQERAHFSRELHDEVGQALNAISINLGTLARVTEGNAAAQERINDTIALIARTAEEVHRFARELRPAMLDELGLEAALRACVRTFAERTGIRVEFHGRLPGHLLAADQRTVIYRVAQESLNNVAKHAKATHVDVILWREGGQAILEIRDNGRGFVPTPRRVEPDRQRLGLLGMEERVRLVNGQFKIGSRPGAGTIVRVEIPLDHSSRRALEAGSCAPTEQEPSPTPPTEAITPS